MKKSNKGGEKIRLKIKSTQYDLDGLGSELFFDDSGRPHPLPRAGRAEADEGSKIELETEGLLRTDGGRIELSYDETELTGMEGSTTALSFDPSDPGLVTMLRDGAVKTVLVFEEGRRHICVYETEFMPFELCIHSHTVNNKLTALGGMLTLDYSIEVRGGASERTKFTLEARTV